DAAIRIPLLLGWTRKRKAAVTKHGAAFCSPNCASGLAALAKGKAFRGFHYFRAPRQNESHNFGSRICLGPVLWRFAQFNAAGFLGRLSACFAHREQRTGHPATRLVSISFTQNA